MLFFILLCPLTYTHQLPSRTFQNEKVTCIINILKIEMVIEKGCHILEFRILAGCWAPRTWHRGLKLDLSTSWVVGWTQRILSSRHCYLRLFSLVLLFFQSWPPESMAGPSASGSGYQNALGLPPILLSTSKADLTWTLGHEHIPGRDSADLCQVPQQ